MKISCCSIFGVLGCFFRIMLDVSGILGLKVREELIDGILAAMQTFSMNPVDVAEFLDLVVSTSYIDLIVASFGLDAFLCVLFGAKKRSEMLLLPALIFIPIDFLKCTFFATIFAATHGSYNPVAIALVILNALHAFIYVPAWLVIYSLRQELLGDDGNHNYKFAHYIEESFLGHKMCLSCCIKLKYCRIILGT